MCSSRSCASAPAVEGLSLPWQDLCDIEEELETKLGVFHVRILGLGGLGHGGGGAGGERGGGAGRGGEGGSASGSVGGDSFEVQLKLSSQKWKARCKVSRGQQIWQDEDVSQGVRGPLLWCLHATCTVHNCSMLCLVHMYMYMVEYG